MKKTLVLALSCAAVMLSAAVPASSTKSKAVVYKPERYAFAQKTDIFNGMNRYTFTVVQSKPMGTTAPRTQYWLAAPKFGFSALVNFFRMTVNGISYADLTPKDSDMTLWKEGTSAGCELKMNFDGAKFILRLYMREDSPVLWGSIRPAKDSVEDVETAEIQFAALVSMLAKNANKKNIWSKGYERMAITPARTLTQRQQAYVLTPADTSLVLQDKKYDGSAADKGEGPVMIILDHTGVAKADLYLRDEWTTTLRLKLKKDFKEFRFGLWQPTTRVSNADLAKKLKADKAQFTLR
ncbi:MAG: hypothetical protein IKB16_10620 [Lentisphaeria bacterium]|nr:hypothetical protein [Lentisphaeria bacterium]